MLRPNTLPKALVAATAVLSLAACGSTSPGPIAMPSATTAHSPTVTPMFVAPFVGGWEITSISSFRATSAEANRILHQGFLSLAANGTVGGFDGVNQWSGHYTQVGNQIRVNGVMAGGVGLASTAPAAQLALVRAFSLIQSAHPMTMTWNGNHLTIKVGHLVLTADPTVG